MVYENSKPQQYKQTFPASMTDFILMFTRGNRFVVNSKARFFTANGFRNVATGQRPRKVCGHEQVFSSSIIIPKYLYFLSL